MSWLEMCACTYGFDARTLTVAHRMSSGLVIARNAQKPPFVNGARGTLLTANEQAQVEAGDH